jgi:hypothetical protein
LTGANGIDSSKLTGPAGPNSQIFTGSTYGVTEGQLGAMKEGDCAAILTSPPYATGDTASAQSIEGRSDKSADWIRKNTGLKTGYGVTEGQLGAMKEGEISSVITSPPWEDQEPSHAQNDTPSKRNLKCSGRFIDSDYGQSDNQLGNTSGDTYWGAVKVIYEQCFLALKPGGYIAAVLKSYVKAGKIVPLPEQTWELLQHVGFEPIERVRAMLVKEDSHPGLFDGPVVKKTERKSFFRRLAERKGSPPIDFEEVLFCCKPL